MEQEETKEKQLKKMNSLYDKLLDKISKLCSEADEELKGIKQGLK